MNNIEDKTNKYCTGCSACVAICPVQAIKYEMNDNGFYEAIVEQEKCINCGKCKKVCSKFLEEKECGIKLEKGKVVSAQSTKKEIIASCTSGGIAYEIAKYGIGNGYKILGTIYDYDKNIARAIIAENVEEIELLKGSKYIQSNIKEAVQKLINECKKNSNAKFIIFGTPCQITGISKAIEVENIQNEIIKIDLFCHGVPSYFVWEKYLEWLKNKQKIDKIEKVNFRSKKMGWHEYCLEIKGNSNTYYEPSERSYFYKCFFDNILLNKSCFNCDVRAKYSKADLRLGDFWGKRYSSNEDGVSLILMLTQIGEELTQDLKYKNKLNILEEIQSKELYQEQNKKEYNYIELQEEAIKDLTKNNNIKSTIKKYRNKMNKKYQIKMFFKELLGFLPNSIRTQIRKIKNQMIG